MQVGIAFPSYIDAWRDAQAAEAAGFSHAWFYDSQMIYSDVYACLALAAEHTERITLGTLVAIPSNRIAPVTASAIATINQLAPGRVILGIGTGYTGRNTMGLSAVPVAALGEYVAQVRGLLAGEDVLFREGDRERWIRLLHGRRREFVNTEDPVPIYIAANGPRAMALAGALGDGWVTAGASPTRVPVDSAAVRQAAVAAGKPDRKPFTVALTTGLVLEPGETLSAPRVQRWVGPGLVPGVHAMWERAYGGGAALGRENQAVADAYARYIEAYGAERGTPADRRYLDVHEGHMVYLKPGEEAFLNEAVIAQSLTGDAAAIRERVAALEAAGVDAVAIGVANADHARALIESFGRDVIPQMSR